MVFLGWGVVGDFLTAWRSEQPHDGREVGAVRRRGGAQATSASHLKSAPLDAHTGAPSATVSPRHAPTYPKPLCLVPYGGPSGWAFSYERGTPVPRSESSGALR